MDPHAAGFLPFSVIHFAGLFAFGPRCTTPGGRNHSPRQSFYAFTLPKRRAYANGSVWRSRNSLKFPLWAEADREYHDGRAVGHEGE